VSRTRRYLKLTLTLALRAIVPIAVTLGIVFPTLLGAAYGDIVAGYIYPGLVARVLSTFRHLFWRTNEVTRRCSLALHILYQFVWFHATSTNTHAEILCKARPLGWLAAVHR